MNAKKDIEGNWKSQTTQNTRTGTRKYRTNEQSDLVTKKRKYNIPFTIKAQEFDITNWFDLNERNRTWKLKDQYEKEYNIIKDAYGKIIGIKHTPTEYQSEYRKNYETGKKDIKTDTYLPHDISYKKSGLLQDETKRDIYTYKKGGDTKRYYKLQQPYTKEYKEWNETTTADNLQALSKWYKYKPYTTKEYDQTSGKQRWYEKKLIRPDTLKEYYDEGLIKSEKQYDDYTKSEEKYADERTTKYGKYLRGEKEWTYDKEEQTATTKGIEHAQPQTTYKEYATTKEEEDRKRRANKELKEAKTNEEILLVMQRYGMPITLQIPYSNITITGKDITEAVNKVNEYYKNETNQQKQQRYIGMVRTLPMAEAKQLILKENPELMIKEYEGTKEGRQKLVNEGYITGIYDLTNKQSRTLTKEEQQQYIQNGTLTKKGEVPIIQQQTTQIETGKTLTPEREKLIAKYYGNLDKETIKWGLKDREDMTNKELAESAFIHDIDPQEIIQSGTKGLKLKDKKIYWGYGINAISIPKELYDPTLNKEENLNKIYNEIQEYYQIPSATTNEWTQSNKANKGTIQLIGSFVTPAGKTIKAGEQTTKWLPHIVNAVKYGTRGIGLSNTLQDSISPRKIEAYGQDLINKSEWYTPQTLATGQLLKGYGWAGDKTQEKAYETIQKLDEWKNTGKGFWGNTYKQSIGTLGQVPLYMLNMALENPASFYYTQKAFGESVRGVTGGIDALRGIKTSKPIIGEKTAHVLGRIAGDAYDIGDDMREVLPYTPKEAWLGTTLGLIAANYALDAPFNIDWRHPLSYSLKPHDVTIDKYRAKEFKDLSKITRIASEQKLPLKEIDFKRVEGSNLKLAEDLKTFFQQQQDGFMGGSTIHETTGVKLARKPQDIEWYTDNLNFKNQATDFFTKRGHEVTTKKGALIIDKVKIDVNPLRTGVSNIQTVTRGKWQNYVIQTPDKINIIDPRVLMRRAFVGAWEKGSKTGEKYARYSKDIPRLLALQDLALKKQLDYLNQQSLLRPIKDYKTGYGTELLKRYEIPPTVQRISPIKYRGYEQTTTKPELLTQQDIDVVKYATKQGGYLGGSSAMYMQTPNFREYGDIDIYFKDGANINKIANDILSITKQTNNKAYIEKATNHIKIKDAKGNDIYDIGIRNEGRDKIITIDDIKMRKLNQIIKDKKEIIKHVEPKSAKYRKAINDIKIAEANMNKQMKTTYTLKNKYAMLKALKYPVREQIATIQKMMKERQGTWRQPTQTQTQTTKRFEEKPISTLTKRQLIGSGETEMFYPEFENTEYETYIPREYKWENYRSYNQREKYPAEEYQQRIPYPENYQQPEGQEKYPYIIVPAGYPTTPTYPYTPQNPYTPSYPYEEPYEYQYPYEQPYEETTRTTDETEDETKTRKRNQKEKEKERLYRIYRYNTYLRRLQDPWYRITAKRRYSNILNRLLRERYGNIYA